MRIRTLTAAAAAALLPAGLWAGTAAFPAPAAANDVPVVANESAADPASMGAAPYLYYGWGDPPDAVQLMQDTGVEWFTLAFILSDGGCEPAWDGTRPLDGADADRIREIREAGGDVMPSIGGWAGEKLGENCPDSESLAAAYQKVIDAYELAAIDIDIEASEIENEETQDRVLGAVRIVKDNNPDVEVLMTLGTTVDGPNQWGERLVTQGAETDAGVDEWTIMPFNFGGSDMAADTQRASEGLNDVITSAYGVSEEEAFAMQGISSMNGMTDTGETVTPDAYSQMRGYAQSTGMGRFTFWSVNRDRPCDGGRSDSCSGIDQEPWEFTGIIAGFGG